MYFTFGRLDIALSSYWLDTVVQNDQEEKGKEKMPKITAVTLSMVNKNKIFCFDVIFKGG